MPVSHNWHNVYADYITLVQEHKIQYIKAAHGTLNSIKDINVEINKEDEKRKYMFAFLEKSQKLANFWYYTLTDWLTY